MPGKKKKFIDKKNAVTFHLVHRSQRDPLAVDDEAPQHVLLEQQQGGTAAGTAEGRASAGGQAAKAREEQIKYGIYFEDDYNYLQHLRDLNEINDVGIVDSFRVGGSAAADVQRIVAAEHSTSLRLPSTVFGSTVETEVGLLNRAVALVGPQPDLDPDVVAAMDEDFDFDNPDNELDDDFMNIANGDVDPTKMENEDDDDQWEDDDDDEGAKDSDGMSNEANDSDNDEVGSLGEMSFTGEETRTRFTNYSMSSSVIRRNQGLTLLDDKFEKFYEQYDKDEIGALDGEDITGSMSTDSRVLKQILDEFEKEQKVVMLKDVVEKGEPIDEEDEDSSEEEEEEKIVVEMPSRQFDCESILSTRSTLYNHPKTIPNPPPDRIKLTKRAQIPAGVLPIREPAVKQAEDSDEGELCPSALTIREKGETLEEKKARKQAVKDVRRKRREEKSANKKAFKDEQIRQDKELINIKQNLQAVRIV